MKEETLLHLHFDLQKIQKRDSSFAGHFFAWGTQATWWRMPIATGVAKDWDAFVKLPKEVGVFFVLMMFFVGLFCFLFVSFEVCF